jgi:adenine-specific DNA methylase
MAYIRDITEGRGSSSSLLCMPLYPRGMPVPKEKEAAALGVLLEVEGEGWEDEEEDESEHAPPWPFEFAMAVAMYAMGDEPRNIDKACKCDDWLEWETSLQHKIDQHKATRTWKLMEPPEGANIIGSQWVFQYKMDTTGNIVKHKSQLVAQGFSQVEGIDYKVYDIQIPLGLSTHNVIEWLGLTGT